jgi:hypothetical protein
MTTTETLTDRECALTLLLAADLRAWEIVHDAEHDEYLLARIDTMAQRATGDAACIWRTMTAGLRRLALRDAVEQVQKACPTMHRRYGYCVGCANLHSRQDRPYCHEFGEFLRMHGGEPQSLQVCIDEDRA